MINLNNKLSLCFERKLHQDGYPVPHVEKSLKGLLVFKDLQVYLCAKMKPPCPGTCALGLCTPLPSHHTLRFPCLKTPTLSEQLRLIFLNEQRCIDTLS